MSLQRLKNLKDTKIGKLSYLKYGLGEIVLVVIGILIAVQINNLNEEYKEKKVKNDFLINLKEEIILDTLLLSNKIVEFEKINESISKGILLLNKKKHSDLETSIFEKAISRIMVLTPLNKNTNKNNSKISNGIIDDVNLNNLIMEYYEKINYHNEVMRKFGETLQLIYINQISPYIKINSQNREYSLELLKDNYAFNNAFYISLGYREQSIKWLKIQKTLALEILKNL